ncbi:DUF3667 domain-containing protein [Neotamlana laminarinivorans]|uniref:DUF3667 domain-containing protein n=1 Tax=Neotamlana laminarinivorans TaxID=2883124 RepID=A0A9X1HXY9_9FLAO|nr:DUF3667 domain-containing protein [Tamlana laminarinivorans]MCB4797631.1 DUF3667 domain-containing protein [Tamlana laminarinivorans]
MGQLLEVCKNCDKTYYSKYRFCPHCGQQTKDKLTVGVLFANTIKNYFSVDARFFKSFFPLLFKPGFLARKFVEGKRLLFLHPAQMYLFITVVFFFLFSFVQKKQADNLNKELAKTIKNRNDEALPINVKDSLLIEKSKIEDSLALAQVKTALTKTRRYTNLSEAEIDSITNVSQQRKGDFSFDEQKIDSLIVADASDEDIYKAMGMDNDSNWFAKRMYRQILKFYKSRQGGSVLEAFYDTIPIAMFFLLPIFALILKLLYYKKGVFANHLVFCFYFFAYLFTVFSFLIAINYLISIPAKFNFLIALSTFIYFIIALKNFYKQGWFISFFKGGITSFVFLLIVAPFTASILGFIAFFFY